MPFLFLGGAHLDRWRGNALALVGDAEALAQLNAALDRLPPTWARARSRLLVDLAYTHAAAGDRDAALSRAREARTIARQISSDRQLRRLDRLVLPQDLAVSAWVGVAEDAAVGGVVGLKACAGR